MPFAPSVDFNFAKIITGSKFFSNYMQVAYTVKKKYFNKMKAAIHNDFSSRIHMVKKNQNLKYWKLLQEMKKIIGVPVVLNTSFNRHGIATISSPRQAIEHALEGCMDFLFINIFIIKISDNRKFNKKKIQTISEKQSILNDQTERLKKLKSKKIKFNQSKYKIFLKDLKKELNG